MACENLFWTFVNTYLASQVPAFDSIKILLTSKDTVLNSYWDLFGLLRSRLEPLLRLSQHADSQFLTPIKILLACQDPFWTLVKAYLARQVPVLTTIKILLASKDQLLLSISWFIKAHLWNNFETISAWQVLVFSCYQDFRTRYVKA
jgi:hypothetical protein